MKFVHDVRFLVVFLAVESSHFFRYQALDFVRIKRKLDDEILLSAHRTSVTKRLHGIFVAHSSPKLFKFFFSRTFSLYLCGSLLGSCDYGPRFRSLFSFSLFLLPFAFHFVRSFATSSAFLRSLSSFTRIYTPWASAKPVHVLFCPETLCIFVYGCVREREAGNREKDIAD